ncbi:uncharacterized protein LOC142322642 [Lycorma delicatula]|uniref:uncharacterized protein LOC142322642 n=1 Tax=Lycorma delicatula TaxID=130591 RepID=UPI003F514D2A
MNRSEETVQTEFLPVQTSADLSTQSEISQNNGSEENVVTCNKSDFSFQTEADVQSLAPFQGECMKKSSFKNKSTSTGEGCSNYSVKELLTALSSSEITFQPRNSEIINNTLSAYCSFQDCNQAVQIYYERMLDLAEELKEKRKKLLGKGYRPKDFQEDLNMQYGSTNCQWLER